VIGIIGRRRKMHAAGIDQLSEVVGQFSVEKSALFSAGFRPHLFTAPTASPSVEKECSDRDLFHI